MFYAQVVKLVDTLASGASLRKKVEVQVLSWAPFTLFMPAQKTVGTPGTQAKLVRVRLRLKRCFNNAYLTLSWAPFTLFMPAQKTVDTPGPQAKLVGVRLRLKLFLNDAYPLLVAQTFISS